MIIRLRLPFPPTANHYNAQRVVMSCGKPKVFYYRTAKAKMFYDTVAALVIDKFNEPPLITSMLSVWIELTAPSKHRRDVSNYAKCIEDALQAAGLFIDDSQIDDLKITRLGVDPAKVGWADVTITSVERAFT